MAPKMVRAPGREARFTVLIVGEGLAECCFLSHLKSLFLARASGRSVQVKDAKGKGGKGVLDYTIRQRNAAAYDHVAALLDTDAAWDDQQRKRARQAKVQVLESNPCLEAVLLCLHGVEPPTDAESCKLRFEQRFGGHAHDPTVYARHFGHDFCAAARQRHPMLNEVLCLLGS